MERGKVNLQPNILIMKAQRLTVSLKTNAKSSL